jgi:hypothetical protein
MAWLAKISLIVCMLVSVIGFGAPITASADELYKVTVTVNIENPNYFWQYPVLGKQLDRISISSFGKTVFIPSSTDTQKLEIEVPQDYHLRLHINLQNGNSTVQSITYVSKEGIHRPDQNFTINLKAPDPQPAIISSPDFDIARR